MRPLGDAGSALDHRTEALKLEAQGYYTLYSIRMSPPGEPEVTLNLSPTVELSWQGVTWEPYAVLISDFKQETSGEVSRPKLTLFNPRGFFSRYVHERWMDEAVVSRYRVLKNHMAQNRNSYLLNTWRVGKVISLSSTAAVFELRSVLDWHSFVMPPRTFTFPEFTAVSL